MKRIFQFAASVSLSAALASAAFAEGNGPNLFGDNTPNQNVVQPEQSRGQLGGLGSGAPSFASNLRDLRGPGSAVAAQAQIAQQPVGQNVAQGQTVVQSQTVAVQKQAITSIQSFHQLGMVIHHCILHTPHKFQAGASPFAPFGNNPVSFTPAVAKTPGDLEIAAVGMVAEAGPQQGPLYRVTIRNNSETPSRHFEVSLIAVRGQLNHTSPVVTVHVDEIAAGGVHELDVQLPIGVMSLSLNNQAAPFESLVAAIDSFDQLIETNELNNVAILTRGEIALIETATAETTETTVTAPATAAPNATAPSATSPIDTELDDDNTSAPGTDSAAPAPGDSTLSAPQQQNVAPPAQQNVAPQGAPSGNPAPNAGPAPAPSAAPNVAPAEANPQANGSSTGLEALVPKTGGM